MIESRILLILSVFLISPFVINGQSEKLLPMENYIIGQIENPVLPRNASVGVLEERSSINTVLNLLFLRGPEIDSCAEEMFNILKVKYDMLTWDPEASFKQSLSMIRENDQEYSGKFLVESSDYKIKGTIYLSKKDDRWLLYDFEVESQEISNP